MKNLIKTYLLMLPITTIITSGYGQRVIEGELPKNQMVYRCAPCGCINDGDHFDSMGVCPSCDMTLVPTFPGVESQLPPIERLTAGILIFDHADIMDVTGPWSVLVHNGVNVVSVAKSKEPVTIGMTMTLTPDFTLENLPDVDILIFPGSGLAETNPGDEQIQQFIKERANKTKVLFSVCSGAFFLAESGLLDGKEATTFAGLIPRLKDNYPKINVVNDVKYTDNGQIVTTAGLSSGIDGAFYVVSKFRGEGVVQDVANHMEYAWAREDEYARTQLADNYIRGIKNIAEAFAKQYISSNGDRNKWEYKYVLSGQLSSSNVLKIIESELENTDRWKLSSESKKMVRGVYAHSQLGQANIIVEIISVDNEEVLSIRSERINQYSSNKK